MSKQADLAIMTGAVACQPVKSRMAEWLEQASQ